MKKDVANYGALDESRRRLSDAMESLTERVKKMREYGVDDLVEEVYGSRRVLLMYTGGATLFLFLSATIYTKCIEAWPWLTAFYFTGYVVTGIGYGDIRIHTSNWRYLVLAFIEFVGSLLIGTLLSVSLGTLVLKEDEEDVRSTRATRSRFSKFLGIVFIVLTCSATVVGVAEDWSWAETIYWAVDTTVTVGNGYRTPDSPVGRGFSVVVFVVAAPSTFLLLTTMIFYPRARLREIFRDRAFNSAVLEHDEDPNAFTVRLLLDARILHPDDVHAAIEKYHALKQQHHTTPAMAA